MILYFGKPTEDAQRLLEKLLILEHRDMGTVKFQKNSSMKLRTLLWISKRMKNLFNVFYDIVVIDSTFKKNRFNMHIIDFVGVNNNGHNILFGFALMEKSQKETIS